MEDKVVAIKVKKSVSSRLKVISAVRGVTMGEMVEILVAEQEFRLTSND